MSTVSGDYGDPVFSGEPIAGDRAREPFGGGEA